MGCGIKKLKIF